MDREEFFFHGVGQGKAKNLRGGARKGSKSAGRSKYCESALIEIIYVIAEETLICIVLALLGPAYLSISKDRGGWVGLGSQIFLEMTNQ